MPHRTMRDSLQAERERILTELAELELQDGVDAEAQRGTLTRALQAVEGSLKEITPRRMLRVLPSRSFVPACSVPWEVMVGTARVRRCLECDHEAFDLTALGAEEVETFLAERAEGATSKKLRRRSDGRYQFGLCPGARRRIGVWALWSAMLLGLAALVVVLWAAPIRPGHAARPPVRPRRIETNPIRPYTRDEDMALAIFAPDTGRWTTCCSPGPAFPTDGGVAPGTLGRHRRNRRSTE